MASNGFIALPSAGIPAVATVGDLPVTGSAGQIYVVTSTGILYAWSTSNSAWESQGGTGTFSPANLTESTSSVLTITGGTNAVNGTGTAIQVKQANTSQSGFLSSTDWNIFNNKAPTASPTFSGTIGTALTASKTVVTDASGNLSASTTTSTELGYVHGVTSAIQTQLNALAPSEYNAGNSGTSLTVTWTNGAAQKITLTGSCTFTFASPQTGAPYVLRLIQDGTGNRTVTWPASTKWPGGTAPTLSTAAGAIDLINLYYDGSSYYGTFAIGFA